MNTCSSSDLLKFGEIGSAKRKIALKFGVNLFVENFFPMFHVIDLLSSPIEIELFDKFSMFVIVPLLVINVVISVMTTYLLLNLMNPSR